MSILIKGMAMPTSCMACQFSGFGGLRNERVVCMFTGANAYMNEVQYLDDCPLVPVPPHGRLIDADALPTNDKPIGKLMMFGGEYVYTQTAINNAPTIIPAEEET